MQNKKPNKNKLKNFIKTYSKKIKNNKKDKVKDSRKKFVGFDIEEDYIRIIEGRYYKENLSIYKCVEVETPKDCINDGNIINSEILAEKIKETLSQNRIRAKHACVTTNSTQIINREMIIPKVQNDELDTVVNYEISKYLPINLNNCIVESLMIDEVEIEGEEKLKIYTICYPEKMARAYFDLIQAINLKPYCLDIKFNSLNKIINYSQLINDKDYYLEGINAFINIESVSTDINIYKKGKVDFTRIIRQGYKTLEEYENDHQDESGAEVLIEELERIFQFYKNRVRGTKIEKIYLLGEGSRVENLDIYMSERLDIPVESIEYVDFIDFKRNSDYEDEIYKYLNVMGSIIRV